MRFHQVQDDLAFHSAPDRFLARAHLITMKEPPPKLLNNSIWDRISKGVWNKFSMYQQSEEMYKKKMDLWRYLYIVCKRIYPRFTLYTVGSTISGFGIDSSDVDMCLFNISSNQTSDPRADAIHNLNILKKYLQHNTGTNYVKNN